MGPVIMNELREFRAPQTMTPSELGDSLARLVWESFSDFVTEGDAEALLGGLGLTDESGVPKQHAAEEILILLLWAHTRGVQLAFLRRSSDELIRRGLDAMHAAVFEDMVAHGTPRAQLPIFEQRVSARYAEYHAAADVSDVAVGETAALYLVEGDPPAGLAPAITERVVLAANPLRDFLEDVDLVE